MSAPRVLVALAIALFALQASATGAEARLQVSVTPPTVVLGEQVEVRIGKTRARRCVLTIRSDRYRAAPSLRRRVARRSTVRIGRRVGLGAKVLTVRCRKRTAEARLRVRRPSSGSPGDGDLPGDEEFPADDPFPDDLDPGDWPEEEEEEEEEPPIDSSDTRAPSKPTGLARAAASTSTITMSWNAATDDVGVTGYSVYKGSSRVASTTARSYRLTGLTCGQSYPLGVLAYDAAGNRSAKASATLSTAACPRAVAVTKGASAQGRPGCSSSACRFVQIAYSGFSSGAHTITCRASGGDEGGFYSYSRSGASGTSAVCYYGFSGRQVWATVDGVASPKVGW